MRNTFGAVAALACIGTNYEKKNLAREGGGAIRGVENSFVIKGRKEPFVGRKGGKGRFHSETRTNTGVFGGRGESRRTARWVK